MAQDVKVRELFRQSEAFKDSEVCVQGWIRNNRGNNKFGFIELNDGTFFKPVQIVLEAEALPNYQEITKPGDTTVTLPEADGNEKASVPAEHMLELLIPTTAEVLAHYGHKYWGKYAAATANTFGKGRAYYLGTVGDPSLMKNILARARADIFTIRPDMARPEAERFSFPLIVREGRTADGRVIRFVMNFSSDDVSVENVWGDTRDLLTGQTFSAGETLIIKDWGVLVLEF